MLKSCYVSSTMLNVGLKVACFKKTLLLLQPKLSRSDFVISPTAYNSLEMAYNFISEVTPTNKNITIKVKVIRLWKSPLFGNRNEEGSIQLVFLDEKGDKIHAIIKKLLISKFVAHFKEGDCYTISNFGVAENNTALRVCNHPNKINFFFTTSVKKCDKDFAIPFHGFKFVTFEQIKSGSLDEKYLIDIFGEVSTVGSIQEVEKDGTISKILTLELKDDRGEKINCSLWNKYADEATQFLNEFPYEPVVLIVQLAQIKEWRGVKTISNSMFASRLIFNAEFDEVKKFRESLSSGGNVRIRSSPISQSSVSIADEFLYLNEKKTLDEILKATEPTFCTTIATITALQLEHGWFYLACKKCLKKVTNIEENMPESEGKSTMFHCPKCNKTASSESIIHRYKVQFEVTDDSRSASFVMFDREVRSILKKSAYDLKEKLTEGDDEAFPEELNAFVGRKFLFKVEISNYNLEQNWEVYTVSKLSAKEDLIESYLNSFSKYQDGVSATIATEETDPYKECPSSMRENETMSEVSPISALKRKSMDDDDTETGALEQSNATKKVKIEKA